VRRPALAVAALALACAPTVRFEATPAPSAAATATATTTTAPTPSATASGSPSASPSPVADVLARIDQSRLDAHLAALTAVGSRDPRSPGHAKAVAYIRAQLAAIPGVIVSDQRTSYQGIPLENVFATIAPLPDARTEGALGGLGMIATHYDSTAVRTPGWDPARDAAPGADDNATGTAALLEYARILASERAGLRSPIVLAFFDGEELFFKGSAAYLESLPPPVLYEWVIDIDMVGFNPLADRLDLVYYTAGSAGLRDRVREANARYAIGVQPLVEQLAASGATILDAAPFGLAGIPSVALVERYGGADATYPGNTAFHTVNDTPDRVTNRRLWMKAAKLTLATALELARGEVRP